MRFLTAGESHGSQIAAIIEGVPAGFEVTENYIEMELLRRKCCLGRSPRMEFEKENILIVSGVRKGVSTGAPIMVVIPNSESENKNKDEISKLQSDVYTLRPGHSDLAGVLKFGFKEARNVIERASARESAARVAVGAIAKRFLKEFGISFASAILQVGTLVSSKKITFSKAKKLNPFFPFADKEKEREVIKLIQDFKEKGETLGGKVWVSAKGVVPGIGSYTNWDKRLDAQIGYQLMSIPSVKGVTIGKIEETLSLAGRLAQDKFENSKKEFFKRKTNKAGGVEGGVSNGENIEATVFVKPLSSSKFLNGGFDLKTMKIKKPEIPRSDTTSLAPIAVICESLLAIVLMENYLEKFGSDSLRDIKKNYLNYKERLKL